MALDIYFRADIARVLAALDTTNNRTVALLPEQTPGAEHIHIYRQGYRDALVAVAVAFGILGQSVEQTTFHARR